MVGAINGPTVTGGFEVALQCDFLVASERASFGDTHARVGFVAHEELLPFCRALAADVVGNDQRAVAALLAEYDAVTATTVEDGLRIEADNAARWNADPETTARIEARRDTIIQRGRTQL